MSFSDPGAIADVTGGGAFDPAWGNAIRDRCIGHFANAAARDAAITVPKEGMTCHLNDLDQDLTYDGVAWRLPWNMAWGAVGYAQAVANQNGVSAQVDLTNGSVTWTAVANRTYKATSLWQVLCNTGATFPLIRMTTASNVLVNQSSQNILTAAYVITLRMVHVSTSIAAGSMTWKMRGQCITNTCDFQAGSNNPGFLLVEDIGPSGVAA